MTLPDWVPSTGEESVVWQGRPRRRVVHWGVVGGVIGVLLVVVVAVAAVRTGTISVGLAAVVGVPLAAVALTVPSATALLRWRSTRYLLTDTALYHRTGIASITVTELGLSKIQNTTYTQGVFGTMFDHGTVTVDTAGSQGAELTLRDLNDPQAVQQRIAERATRAGGGTGDGIPGSIEQWRRVRTEVRRIRAALTEE